MYASIYYKDSEIYIDLTINCSFFLQKKQPRTKSPGKTPRMTQASQDVILDGQIDREG